MSSSISSISATLGGTISSDGGSAILERGVVFSQSVTNADPSIGGPGTTGHIAASAGTGMFTVSVSGLVPGTGYSFKAYATNAKGTGYSSLGSWISGRAFSRQRYRHTATLLASGKVLITGGYNDEGFTPITTSALYDPVANNWSAAASLNTGRLTHTATLLADGRILIAGGNTEIVSNPLASAEIYSPPGPVISTGEGQSATKTGTFSDAEGNATVTIQASSGAITQNNPAGIWSWTATGEDGPATSNVIVTALDTPGGVSRASFTFSVTNRPPTAGVTGPAVAVAGVPVGFSFTAADPAPLDQAAGFAWSVNYGDGTTVETTAAGTASPLVRSHTFSSAGTFTVMASATDKNSGKGTSTGNIISVFSGLQGWRLFHFGSINNGGNAAGLVDADGDGLVNLIEFAFGLNPNSGASAQLPAAQRIGSNLVLTFPEPPGVAGSVIYRAESSTDLSSGNWFPVADTGTGGIHTFRVPMAGRPKVFIRLVVTEP